MKCHPWEKRNEEGQINDSILHWEEEGTEIEKRLHCGIHFFGAKYLGT
jgi:hypothetical protein